VYKRKVTLNSFKIDDILLPSVTNGILKKSPQKKIVPKTSVKHSPMKTPRNDKDLTHLKVQTPRSSAKKKKLSAKSNRTSIKEPSSPVVLFGGMSMKHSPVRTSMVM
jgi:hypothetical protein